MSASPQVQSELELVKQVQKLANQHTPKTKRITLQIGDDAAGMLNQSCPIISGNTNVHISRSGTINMNVGFKLSRANFACICFI